MKLLSVSVLAVLAASVLGGGAAPRRSDATDAQLAQIKDKCESLTNGCIKQIQIRDVCIQDFYADECQWFIREYNSVNPNPYLYSCDGLCGAVSQASNYDIYYGERSVNCIYEGVDETNNLITIEDYNPIDYQKSIPTSTEQCNDNYSSLSSSALNEIGIDGHGYDIIDTGRNLRGVGEYKEKLERELAGSQNGKGKIGVKN